MDGFSDYFLGYFLYRGKAIHCIKFLTAVLKIRTFKYIIYLSPKARANQTGINFMIFISIVIENCL